MWLILLAGSCRSPDSVPLTVVGDGEHGVVLRCELLRVQSADPAHGLAASDEEWAAMCQQFGGDFVCLPQGGINFASQQRIAVTLPLASQLRGMVVSSEEGVDVITLDVESQVPTDAPGGTACLLHLSRRSCQLAVVLRDQERGEEQFVAVFPGL